jgi:hypothetical protein
MLRFCRKGRSAPAISTSFDNRCLENIYGSPLSDEGKAARSLLFVTVASDSSLFRDLQEQLRQSRYITGAGTVAVLNDSKFLQHMGTRVLDPSRKIKQDRKSVDSCQRDKRLLRLGLELPIISAPSSISALATSASDADSTHNTIEPQVKKPQYVVVERQRSWRKSKDEGQRRQRRRRQSMTINIREEEKFHCPNQGTTLSLGDNRQQSHGTQPFRRLIRGWSRTSM